MEASSGELLCPTLVRDQLVSNHQLNKERAASTTDQNLNKSGNIWIDKFWTLVPRKRIGKTRVCDDNIQECRQPSKSRPATTNQKLGRQDTADQKPWCPIPSFFFKTYCNFLASDGEINIVYVAPLRASFWYDVHTLTISTYLPLLNCRWSWLTLFTFSSSCRSNVCGNHKEEELLTIGGSVGYWVLPQRNRALGGESQ